MPDQHIDLIHAQNCGPEDANPALLRRSLRMLTDQLNQAEADRDTLADALRDIEKAMTDPDLDWAVQHARHVCGLPAIQNAMGDR